MKNLKNLGKVLSKAELQTVNGGLRRCQRLLFGLTAAQCVEQGGNYTTSGYCVITISGCNDPFLPELP